MTHFLFRLGYTQGYTSSPVSLVTSGSAPEAAFSGMLHGIHFDRTGDLRRMLILIIIPCDHRKSPDGPATAASCTAATSPSCGRWPRGWIRTPVRDRYLHLEGEGTDLRTVRRTVTWIRDAFAAAARREQKPGTARLILLDADRFEAELSAMPSLEAFAADRGLEEFSEAGKVEAYLEAYSAATGGARNSRRARVIERLLQALQWLEALVAQDPRPGNAVAA